MFKDGKLFTAPPMDRISPGLLGVRTFKKDKAFKGYTMFSNSGGYTRYLIDMNGLVVHTWPVKSNHYGEILPNGNLLADQAHHGLHELRPDGQEVWFWSGNCHHDFEVLPNDNIILLTGQRDPVLKGFFVSGREPDSMFTDIVVEINRQGDILWSFSFRDHVDDLCAASGLKLPVAYAFETPDGSLDENGVADWAHTNTLEVLPDTPLGRQDKRFRAGNLLFSLRILDIIGIIDREQEKIVWAWGLGELDGQHQPTMLANGNILLFDNGTYRRYSRVIELNPATGKIVWEYQDGKNVPPDRHSFSGNVCELLPERSNHTANFFSPYRSGVQRLPNGNTLICESDAGRIFEVTPDHEIVWDYYSPFMAQGPEHEGRHIYRATRYTAEQVRPVFEARQDKVRCVANEKNKTLSTYLDILKYYSQGYEG